MSFTNLNDIIELTGKSSVRRSYPYFDWFCQVESRLQYLASVREHLRKLEHKVDYRDIRDDDSLNRSVMLEEHVTFCMDTLDRLDIYNTIDHLKDDALPEDVYEYYLDWKEYIDSYPRYVMDVYFSIDRKPAQMDEIALSLVKATYAVRRSEYQQRLTIETEQCHDAGWFFVFDTLTLDPNDLKDFYDDDYAIRDYTRSIGRLINVAAGRKVGESYNDIYRYFIVPEYGDLNGRLHFHCLHMMKYLPVGTIDPAKGVDFRGNSVRHRREIDTFKGVWKYGRTMPISVRYAGDNFTVRQGWLVPVDKKTGLAVELKPLSAVTAYITKYVSKNVDTKQSKKLERSKKKWQSQLMKIKVQNSERKFRIRMTRGFGTRLAPMTALSVPSLMEMMQLHWSASRINAVLKKNASAELVSRLGEVTLAECLGALPPQMNMLQRLRNLMKQNQTSKLLSFIDFARPKLTNSDISNETRDYLQVFNYGESSKQRFERSFGSK